VPAELERVQDQVREVFVKLAQIDFNAIATAMTHAFEGIDRVTNSPELNRSLRSLDKTIPKFDEAVASIKQLAVTLDDSVNVLSADLQQTSGATREALTEIQAAVRQAGVTMKEAEGTLTSVRAVIDPESPTFY